MRASSNGIRLHTAALLALVLGGYLYSSSADGSEAGSERDISRVNSGVNVEAGEQVGDVSSVNGGIRIGQGAGAGEVSTVNGSIELEDDTVVESAETVNGGIRVGQGVAINGSLRSINGGIRTGAGTVVEDLVRTVNGRVRLSSTQVNDNVETSNGDIDILDGSTVEGDIVVKGARNWWSRIFSMTRSTPELTIDETSRVLGNVHLHREVELNVADGARTGEIIHHYRN